MKDKQDSLDTRIAEIEDKLTNLNKELQGYSKYPSSVSKESQQQHDSLDKRLQQLKNKLTSKPSAASQSTAIPTTTKSLSSLPDRKFNLVVYGIPEYQPNADRRTCLKHDLKALLKHLSEIDSEINPSVFKDIY